MFTASRACDMLATIKSGGAAARRDLRTQLVVERLTNAPQDDPYVNATMQRGMEKEADAFAAYEALTGLMAQPVGFLAHDTLLAGCSPDGVIGNFQGLLEIKCPKSATHLAYLRAKTIPKDYQAQMQHALWITGAKWADFISFDDRFPPALQVCHVRLTRNDTDLAAYEIMARAFLAEVDREVAELAAMIEAAA
jgi:hypothetical protein